MFAPVTCTYLRTRLPQLQHRLSRVLVDPQQSRHRTSSTRRQRPTAILLITSVTFWIRSIPRHLRGYTSTLRVCFQVLDMNSCLSCMNNTIFDCCILFALIFTDSWHPLFGGAISWSNVENAMVCTVAEAMSINFNHSSSTDEDE